MAGATKAESTRLRLPETDAQAVLLVRAVEEADRRGRRLSLDSRRRASEEVSGRGPEDRRWLTERAHTLLAELRKSQSRLDRWLGLCRPLRGWLLPTILLATVVGLATQALGPERSVALLSVPLLALVAWNLVVVVVSTLLRLLPRRSLEDTPVERLVGWWQRRLETQTRRWVARSTPQSASPSPDSSASSASESSPEARDAEVWGRAVERFLNTWVPATTPLAVARIRRLLHLGAGTVVAGAVAGMYLRGLIFEYRVRWESTFLDAEAVATLLGWILGPASVVSGIEIPSVVGLEGATGGDAAPWIHLWAVTAALFVGVPRGVLALLEHLQVLVRQRTVAVDLDRRYVQRLRAGGDPRQHPVEIVPYSHTPSEPSLAALTEMLYDFVGARSQVRRHAVVAYGDPVDEALPAARLTVVLFSLAQTPENEVHGEWLETLRRGLDTDQALVVVVDRAPLRRRLGESERLDQRSRTWTRVVREADLPAVVLDLESMVPAEGLEALVAGVWPADRFDA